MEETKCLADEHIYLKHRIAIQEFGGHNGYYNFTQDRVESILAQQYTIFGYDKYPDIYQKAAMLMYFFTKNRCFVDGNKRVGIQSAMVFLMINGYSHGNSIFTSGIRMKLRAKS